MKRSLRAVQLKAYESWAQSQVKPLAKKGFTPVEIAHVLKRDLSWTIKQLTK